MPLRFDAAELQSYLDEVFPQVRGLFVIDEVHEDHLKMRMPVKEAHLRPVARYRPSMFALADCGMYAAILSHLGKEALAVTTNCAIDFMRKPRRGGILHNMPYPQIGPCAGCWGCDDLFRWGG